MSRFAEIAGWDARELELFKQLWPQVGQKEKASSAKEAPKDMIPDFSIEAIGW